LHVRVQQQRLLVLRCRTTGKALQNFALTLPYSDLPPASAFPLSLPHRRVHAPGDELLVRQWPATTQDLAAQIAALVALASAQPVHSSASNALTHFPQCHGARIATEVALPPRRWAPALSHGACRGALHLRSAEASVELSARCKQALILAASCLSGACVSMGCPSCRMQTGSRCRLRTQTAPRCWGDRVLRTLPLPAHRRTQILLVKGSCQQCVAAEVLQ